MHIAGICHIFENDKDDEDLQQGRPVVHYAFDTLVAAEGKGNRIVVNGQMMKIMTEFISKAML